MIRLVLFIFISLQIFSLYSEVKYESVHDETYWFPNEDLLMEGFQIGTVRSNLVWMDRMSVFLQETDCYGAPILYMTLSTSNIRKDYPEFDFSSLEGKFLELGFNFDGKVFEKYEVGILSTFKLQNNNHAVNLWFEEFPIPFYVPWDVLTVKIMENDPNRKYFDLPERQYRMTGFPDVFLYMTEECKKTKS
tara:strand:- start:603 stop:1175 length:573 start_codon:yes stop_codon:yes gene_type:complete